MGTSRPAAVAWFPGSPRCLTVKAALLFRSCGLLRLRSSPGLVEAQQPAQVPFPSVRPGGAGCNGCCSPAALCGWSSCIDSQDVGGAAATATRPG